MRGSQSLALVIGSGPTKFPGNFAEPKNLLLRPDLRADTKLLQFALISLLPLRRVGIGAGRQVGGVTRRLGHAGNVHTVRGREIRPASAFGSQGRNFLHLVAVATGDGIDRTKFAEAQSQNILLGLQFSLAHSGDLGDRAHHIGTFVLRPGRGIKATNVPRSAFSSFPEYVFGTRTEPPPSRLPVGGGTKTVSYSWLSAAGAVLTAVVDAD